MLKKLKQKSKLDAVDWCSYTPDPVVGVDEAGRGCLAGPVVAGAVILSGISENNIFADSKTLSASRREEIFTIIQREHQWAIGFASVLEIERLNIFRASLLAMRRAVCGLRLQRGGHVLVDGKFKIPYLRGFEQTALIQGDARCAPVSAASIVAKVVRDRLMLDLAERFPSYGFEIHKGYATKLHRARIRRHGPCKHHRITFNGVL